MILPDLRADVKNLLVGLSEEQSIEIREIESRVLASTGESVSVSISVGGISAGFPLGMTIIMRDISLRKKTEAALEASRIAAESANNSKSLFLANMSHEIRTPLNAIVGYTELLSELAADKKVAQTYIEPIRRNSRLLLQLLNDILDLAKVEAGKLEFFLKPCLISDVLRNIEQLFRPRADAKRLSFRINIEAGLLNSIVTDEMRLEQILINLVGNALKFTEEGYVELNVSRQILGAETLLLFTVSDSGPGMSELAQKVIFHPFEQGDMADKPAHGGAGLGLVLSQNLALGLGGSLKLIQSELGRGSTFQLQIGLRSAALEPALGKLDPQGTDPLADGEQPFQGLTFLVVDDAADNQTLLAHLISHFGGSAEIASNGREALAKLEGRRFDVILMDLQMPIMDGYAASEAIRERGDQSTILAFSAAVMREDREKALKAGCNAHLAKPIDLKRLVETVQAYHH